MVPREKLDEAIKATADTMKGLAADDPSKPGTICGPLISAKQRERVEGYIKLAVEEGGTIERGGGRPAGKDKGFVEPTLISGLTTPRAWRRRRIFGPVLVIIPTTATTMRSASPTTPYGLSGMVYGTDEDRINHVVNSVRTGTMGVNGGIWYAADVPFGGFQAVRYRARDGRRRVRGVPRVQGRRQAGVTTARIATTNQTQQLGKIS